MSTLKFFEKNLLIISSLAFLLIGSYSLNFLPKKTIHINKTHKISNLKTSKIPLLKNVNSYPLLSAQGVYAVDLNSSVVLYQKNPDLKLLPASTTKMVTALVALDYYNLDDVLNTKKFKTNGSNMGLTWNEDITVRELLYGLLVQSANDAAEVLAINHSEGREKFIEEMNKKIKTINANNSNFENPSGLDSSNQFSTAKDMSRIAQYAMRNITFSEIVATEERIAKSADGVISHRLNNRNELLGRVEGVLGVKTGWTENARENLVSFVERDGRKVMVTILGSQDRFGESEELIEWIFANYEWRKVSSPPLVSL